jgi:hypothetical protein
MRLIAIEEGSMSVRDCVIFKSNALSCEDTTAQSEQRFVVIEMDHLDKEKHPFWFDAMPCSHFLSFFGSLTFTRY